MKPLIAAIRFLTPFPIPGSYGTGGEELARSMPFFPIVGLLLAAAAGAAGWGLGLLGHPLVSGALLVLLLLTFSGGLHMDGLSDTADGFLSSRPRERILEIMKDSHVGAMGVIAIAAVMLLKFAALATVAAERRENLWAAAALAPLAGRCIMVLHLALLPYAREKGLGSIFQSRGRPWGSAVWAMLVLMAAGLALFGVAGLILAGICLGVGLILAAYVYRKIHGATGDTYGAACEVTETAVALVLAVWPLSVRWLWH